MKIRGIYTPAITPLRQDGEIDWDGFAAILEHLVDAGVEGARKAAPGMPIMIHTDLGSGIHNSGIDWVVERRRRSGTGSTAA